MTKHFLFVLLLFPALSGTCQILVNTSPPYDNVQYLVTDVLLGEGVKVSNISYYGDKAQIGYFSNTKNVFGFESGIILSTGYAKEAEVDPGGCANIEIRDSTNRGEGDADLLKVAKKVPKLINQNFEVTTTEDAAILEFDFVIESDSISFRYTFASEEYLKYANSKYNDVFGFFLSGPGINGEYSSPPGFPNGSINIGLIPGTDYPITVSTVNNQINSQYYIDNGGGSQVCADPDPVGARIEYNGYTATIMASLKVIPCETYHIKLAIADGTKSDLDSGVLLEARSFSSGRLEVNRNLGFTIRDSVVVEGCASPSIILSRTSKINQIDTVLITYDVLSQANGSDVTLPDKVIFFPGEVQKVIFFDVVNDGITEGVEELLLNFALSDNCVTNIYKTNFTLDDVKPLAFIKPNNESYNQVCRGDTVTLNGAVKDGYGFYSFRWTENDVAMPEDSGSIKVYPATSTTYVVTVSDTCGMASVSKSFTIVPPNYQPLQVFLADSMLANCPGDEKVLQPDSVIHGSGYYIYRWSFNNTPVGSTSQITVYPQTEGYYTLMVRDSCGTVVTDSIYMRITKYAPISISVSNDTTICSGDSIPLFVNATGGAGNFTYEWENLNTSSQNLIVFPKSDSKYPVTATDRCDSERSATIFVDVNNVKAEFEFIYQNDFDVIVENYSIGDIVENIWYYDREFFSAERNPAFTMRDLDEHTLELIVTDPIGCTDSTEKQVIPPLFIYMPNSFSPNGDGINDVFRVEVEDVREFEMIIYDHWGQQVFISNNPSKGWNGSQQGTGEIVSDVYTVIVKAVRTSNLRAEKIGKVTLIK